MPVPSGAPAPSGPLVPSSPLTRDALLAAAERRYARFGARKTTMAEVAREAGCSRATLYQHFPSKHALYAALLERETARFIAALEKAALSRDGARAKLRRIVRFTLETYADSPVLRDALTGDDEMTVAEVTGPALEEHERRVIALLDRVLAQGVAEGDFRDVDTGAVAYLMYQLGHELVRRQIAGRPDFPFQRILLVMDDVVARGIHQPETETP